jgi:hypothetical protein
MFCLTCRQMPWRTDAARARFKAAGLSVEMFEGVHGPTVGLRPELPHFDSPRHRISAGRMAITVSKILLFQRVVDRGCFDRGPVLLFENDVRFVPNFAAELERSIAALPDDWEVAHVGHCCTDDKPTRVVNDRVSEIRWPLCCHAVLWRNADAIDIARSALMMASWGTNSDIILARQVYPWLRHYSFTPPLAFADGESEAAAGGRWPLIQGWFDFARIYDEALERAERSGRPCRFVEVGAWKGKSTAYMAEEIKRRLVNVTFFAVDTWKGMPFGGLDDEVAREYDGDLFPTFEKNMSRAGVIDYVQPIQGASVEAAKLFDNGSVDFIFIDGDHTTEAVTADLHAWLPKLRADGVIAGHDIDMPTVAAAVGAVLPRHRRWEKCWIAEADRR